jgi:hypothetical protein
MQREIMSAESQSYVERFSPYTGITYMIHLRMGLLANETHDYRLFCGDSYFAQLCRCSEKTVQRGRQTMIEDGYLIEMHEAKGRRVAEFQFVFLGHEEMRIGGHLSSDERMGRHPSPNSKTSEELTLSIELKENVTSTIEDQFNEIWKTYPRRVDRTPSFKAFKAIVKSKRATVDQLATAIHNYAMSRVGEEERFTLYGGTFLGPKEYWRDWLTAPIGATLDDRAEITRRQQAEFEKKKEREHEESRPMPEHMRRRGSLKGSH